MSNTITRSFVANISYNGFTFNTLLIVEYKHSGKVFKTTRKGTTTHTTHSDIADRWKDEGKKVTEHAGYYYMYRLAIPNVTAEGKKDVWYINNHGDSYRINKISKYGRKIHAQLTENDIEPLTK